MKQFWKGMKYWYMLPYEHWNHHAKWKTAAAAKSLQSCPTLCDPIYSSPPGKSSPQARALEWVAISFSNAWKWKVKGKSLSCVSSRPHGLQPTRLLCPWDFPGKSTGVGCHCLLRNRCYLILKSIEIQFTRSKGKELVQQRSFPLKCLHQYWIQTIWIFSY